MKIPTNPPKNAPIPDWSAFVTASRSELFSKPHVFEVETSQQFADLQKRLQSQVRPFAVAILLPKT
jgi:hypothetical protein